MAQDIHFNPAGDIKCDNSLGVPRALTAITKDKTATYTNQIGPFVAMNDVVGTVGKVTLNFGTAGANKEGRIYAGYNGYITFADVADFEYDNPGKPMNIINIPMENNLGQKYYLVATLGVPERHPITGGGFYFDTRCGVFLLTDPLDLTSGTMLIDWQAGTWLRSDMSRAFIIDACYLKDSVFNVDNWDIDEHPFADTVIEFFFYNYNNMNVELPDYFTIRTNNGGTSYMGNTSFTFSFSRLASNLYGWPSATEEFSPEVGPASEEIGYNESRQGAFNNLSDNISIPLIPAVGVSNVGFINVYKTDINALNGLGTELFPPLAYTPPSPISDNQSVSEAIVDGFNQIVTFLANIPSFFDQFMANTLINYVIDCHIIPVAPSGGTSESIHVGYKTLQTSAYRISTDYIDFPCGAIDVGEYYGNFADFYTSAKLYLPFVGFVPTRPEWFTGSLLAVDYRFNVVDGSFTCYVRSGGKHVGNGSYTIVGQYAGNACVHLPITGPTYAAMVSGLIGAGAGMISGAASGNIPMAATSAIAAATSHGDIASSNAYNSSAAFLGCRYPFLMIERPVSNYAKNYQHEIGIPSNVYAKLGDVPGFVRMANVHIDGISGATETEKAEIKRLLAQGVIV